MSSGSIILFKQMTFPLSLIMASTSWDGLN